MFHRFLVRIGLGMCLVVATAASAFAQYGGGTGGSTSGGTSGSSSGYGSSGAAIGVGVGAAVGAGVLYLALRNRGSVVGCVREGAEGVILTSEKDNKTYILSGQSAAIRPGERVELRGKKVKDGSGQTTFKVTKMVKKHGACST